MQRVRKLASHVLSNATSNKDGQIAESLRGGPGLTEAEQMTLMQTMVQYNSDVEKFHTEGVFPDLSIFDLALAMKHELGLISEDQALSLLEEAEKSSFMEVFKKLPGPLAACKTRQEQATLVNDVLLYEKRGEQLFRYAEWQMELGGRGLNSNIAVPWVMAYKQPAALLPRVIVADPEDAERLSRTHVRKEGNFKPVLYNSLIATDDNEHWQKQRRALSDLFLPMSSLAEILPVSCRRAQQCAVRLAELSSHGTAAVDMSDFLLHEAQAQLQLALLGCPEELMEATNGKIRSTFMGDFQTGKIGELGKAMKDIMKHAQEDESLAAPGEGRQVKGPLSRGVQKSELSPTDDYGNMLLILFAGHDTTGHTMTWMLLELARNQSVQRRVQAGVDAWFADLGGQDPSYRDLASSKLDLLDRCVTETLRLWPAVPNGTFRQLQFADRVRGANGEEVQLPKGTPVQITNWHRHRNSDLWGADANKFNPDRAFQDEELARVGGPGSAMNPESARFSPFAHNPRSCLGKNFAQMEMRLIMAYLLKGFDFTLAPPYDTLMDMENKVAPSTNEFRGVNRGTMGPMDLENTQECSWGIRHQYALKLYPKLRQRHSTF